MKIIRFCFLFLDLNIIQLVSNISICSSQAVYGVDALEFAEVFEAVDVFEAVEVVDIDIVETDGLVEAV